MELRLKKEGTLTHYLFEGVYDIMPIILRNMERNKECDEWLIYYDPDIDGVIAGTLASRFVSYILGYETIQYMNSNRAHGFKLDIDTLNPNTNIIGVDFGITDEQMKILTKAGHNVIIMDHHETTPDVILYDNGKKLDYLEYRKDPKKLKTLLKKNGVGIQINNQYEPGYVIKTIDNKKKKIRVKGEDPRSKYLSGAGVVFESVYYYLKNNLPNKLEKWDTKEQRGMVGWTLLSDIRNLEENPVCSSLYLQDLYTYNPKEDKGITDPNSDILANLWDLLLRIENRQVGARKWNKERDLGQMLLDRNAMDFTISPLMNAHFRFNDGDKIIDFMNGNTQALDLNRHEDQKELQKKMAELVDLECWGKDDSLKTFAIDVNHPDLVEWKEHLTSFVGLLCNKYKENNSVIGYCMDNGKMLRASFRGKIMSAEYKSNLNKANLLVGAGHGAAFGILELDPTPETFREIARVCEKSEEGYDKLQCQVVECKNLTFLTSSEFKQYRVYKNAESFLYNIAYENMFHTDEAKIRIRYTGSVRGIKSGQWNEKKTLCEFSVNGIKMNCFKYPYSPTSALILPMLSNGEPIYTLDMEDPERPPVISQNTKPKAKITKPVIMKPIDSKFTKTKQPIKGMQIQKPVEMESDLSYLDDFEEDFE